MSAALETLIERYLAEMVEDSPIAGTYLGLHEHDDRLGDFRVDALDEENARRGRLLADLEALPLGDASVDARIDAVVLRTALRGAILWYEDLREYRARPATYVRAALSGCHLLLARDYAPLPDRARSLLSRLKQVPGVLEAMAENIEDPPAVFVQVGVEAARGGIAFLEGVIPGVVEKVPALRSDIERASAAAAESLEGAARHLETIGEDAGTTFAVGKERYEWMLRELHLLDFDSDGLCAMGRSVLAETKREMEEVAREIDPDREWRDILDDLKRDHPTKDALRERYASEMRRARDFVRENDLVTIPAAEVLEVVDTPVFLRMILPYAAYMPAGPFEDEQRGLFYVTPVNEALTAEEQERQLRGHAVHTIPVIALHEGYPGHHLQITRANAGAHLIRKLTWSAPFGEGWALYCEEMMRDAGFYTEAEARLFQLKECLWRAARVVVDVGLQCGEMTIDDAVEFMVKEAMLERVNATAEVKRYAGNPTQPSSYMIGKRAILDIRRRVEARAGGAFDLKRFHDALLDLGNVQPRLAEIALDLRSEDELEGSSVRM